MKIQKSHWDVCLLFYYLVHTLKFKNRASSRLFAQNRVSQVFWDPIKNRVPPRSVLLKAVYL